MMARFPAYNPTPKASDLSAAQGTLYAFPPGAPALSDMTSQKKIFSSRFEKSANSILDVRSLVSRSGGSYRLTFRRFLRYFHALEEKK
jgi:hypothetical protein